MHTLYISSKYSHRPTFRL